MPEALVVAREEVAAGDGGQVHRDVDRRGNISPQVASRSVERRSRERLRWNEESRRHVMMTSWVLRDAATSGRISSTPLALDVGNTVACQSAGVFAEFRARR
jgi:hypothetical protein